MSEAVEELTATTDQEQHIPHIPVTLSWTDKLGSLRVRLGIGRMKYAVKPGLYAVGNPNDESVVLVSANFKMSFDALRTKLSGRDAWVLVLDTKGINVWCAAGKGTFGTDELVNRIDAVGLAKIVTHRTVVVPQLGAPGVSAHEVKKRSGFRIVYGPVRADDLRMFLDAGMKATEQMRRVRFGIWQRTELIPMELVMGAKYAILVAVCFFLLAGLNRRGYSTSLAMADGLRSAALLLGTYFAACILGPVLVPWLPGRAFSVKGLWIGLAAAIFGYYATLMGVAVKGLDVIAWLLILSALASFTVMNFTGATTFTSLSGVRAEMRIAVRLQIIAAAVGIALWLVGRFV